MATIFLSYRRTDGPQACRVYDWLVERFGSDAVFMDVSAIPFAVSFPEFIKEAIVSSKVLIALIGADWHTRIGQDADPVRLEIETAAAAGISILPVLIGNTPMPAGEQLPPSIAMITLQNAHTLGVLRDFDTHMRALLPKIESILGRLSLQPVAALDAAAIRVACTGIVNFLSERYMQSGPMPGVEWKVFGTHDFYAVNSAGCVTLYLHRIMVLADLLDLHFILSVFAKASYAEHALAGWMLHELAHTPMIASRFFDEGPSRFTAKIRRSDEDPRQVWKMITDQPLRLSMAYVATLAPESPPSSTETEGQSTR